MALLEGNWRVEAILGAQSWININHTRAAGLFFLSLSLSFACVRLCVSSINETIQQKQVPPLRRRSCFGFPSSYNLLTSASAGGVKLYILRGQQKWDQQSSSCHAWDVPVPLRTSDTFLLACSRCVFIITPTPPPTSYLTSSQASPG